MREEPSWGWPRCLLWLSPPRGAQTSLRNEQPLMLVEKCPSTHALRQWLLSWGTLWCSRLQETETWRSYWRYTRNGAPCRLVSAQISGGWGAELGCKCQWSAAPEKHGAGSILMGTSVPAVQSILNLFGAGVYAALTHLRLGKAWREGASQMQSGPPGHPPRKKAWCSGSRLLSLNITSCASRQQSCDLSRWWLILTSPLRAISHLWISPSLS